MGKDMMLAMVELLKQRGDISYIEFADDSSKELPSGKFMPLGDTYFVCTGITWYGSIIPLVPVNKRLFNYSLKKLQQNRWDNFIRYMREIVPDIVIPVNVSDIDTSKSGSSMKVFQRIKEAKTDFFYRLYARNYFLYWLFTNEGNCVALLFPNGCIDMIPVSVLWNILDYDHRVIGKDSNGKLVVALEPKNRYVESSFLKETTGQKILQATIAHLTKRGDVGRLLFTDMSPLADAHFVSTGSTWYGSATPIQPVDMEIYDYAYQKVTTASWDNVFAFLRTEKPTIEIPVDISDINTYFPGSAMVVYYRILIHHKDFFTENRVLIMPSVGCSSLIGSVWQVIIPNGVPS